MDKCLIFLFSIIFSIHSIYVKFFLNTNSFLHIGQFLLVCNHDLRWLKWNVFLQMGQNTMSSVISCLHIPQSNGSELLAKIRSWLVNPILLPQLGQNLVFFLIDFSPQFWHTLISINSCDLQCLQNKSFLATIALQALHIFDNYIPSILMSKYKSNIFY
mgnify:CR=1 FL=1